MASIGSGDGEGDFETQNVNANKSKKKSNITLSDEEGSNQGDIVEVVKKTRVNRPPVQKTTKKKNQLSLLSFTQKKVAVAHSKPVSSQKSVQDLKTECPICFKSIPVDKIEVHADSCADDTSTEVLDILSSQENQASDFLDSDIFESGATTRLPKKSIASSSTPSAKRPSWDLENSFDKPTGSTSSIPSKRRKSTSPSTLMVNDVERQQYDLAPYPEFNESKMRGCLRYTGNNPGTSIQNILKKKPVSPVNNAFQMEDRFSSNSKSKAKSSGSSHSFGFKLHPFLAQASSSTSNESESLRGALVPDGEGGFIINDSVFDNADHSDDDDQLSLPPLMSNGFIDFQNQFKESSTPSTSKRKTKTKSPRKKKWKQWRGTGGRGRGGRGGGRNRRG